MTLDKAAIKSTDLFGFDVKFGLKKRWDNLIKLFFFCQNKKWLPLTAY
jgi:hypothetical protein